jgi:hypothetical protein
VLAILVAIALGAVAELRVFARARIEPHTGRGNCCGWSGKPAPLIGSALDSC